MRLAPRLAAALLALAAGCSSSSTAPAPLPTEGPPSALRVSVSGFGYGSHEVVLRGDTLVVTRRAWERAALLSQVATVPDTAAWRAFWSGVRAAGVEAWPRECVNRRIADGGGVALRIETGGRVLESASANAFPQANGRCSASPDYSPDVRTFLTAVSALIGRPYP